MTEEELRKEKERLIKADIKSYENRARHVFNQGYSLGCQQHAKDFVKDREEAYQQGLEDGRRQGVAIDGDKRYWKGYHAAREDGQKIYQKGYEDGARCQDEVQYQKGLEDAWEAARKIYAMTANETIAVFGGCSKWVDYSAIEAIEKIREYEKKQKEARSGYVSFVGEKPQEKGVATVYPDSPCDLCIYNPPGSGDGKPCTMCPAEGKVEE